MPRNHAVYTGYICWLCRPIACIFAPPPVGETYVLTFHVFFISRYLVSSVLWMPGKILDPLTQ
jgi:hypothetical protein